ncbi:hypothetical protein DVH05_001368 [Phytophthora capsici]|nr:hypothetical protein DVH05_001368 [Phytophthora capsici]
MPKRKKQLLQASASPSEPVVRGWEWAYACLWDESKKCGVRMTDTIVFYHDADTDNVNSYLWLFTGKSGGISRKRSAKDGSLPLSKIRERFLQLAGFSSDNSVAIVIFRDGTRKLLGIEEFQDILQALDGNNRGSFAIEKTIEGLQAYIPSNEDQESHIQVEFEISRDALPDFRIDHRSGYLNDMIDAASLQLSSSIYKEAESVTSTVVSYLSRVGGGQVVKASLEFVCDRNQTLWLTHISHIELEGKSLQKKPSLPNLQSEMGSKGNNSVKCRGEFCQTSLESLAGLSKLKKQNQDGNNNTDDSGVDQGILVDDGRRLKMGNNNLLLAHAELDFLKDSTNFSLDHNDFVLKWREVDNVFRMELGRSNPSQFYKQVLVCANCHRVYSEINKLRDMDFQMPRTSGTEELPDAYDKMFLDELKKQSAAIDQKIQEDSRSCAGFKTAKGPEDDRVDRLSSGSNSSRERSVLPCLPTALKPKKKIQSSVHNNQQVTNLESDKVAKLEADLQQTKQKLATVEAKRHKLEQEIVQTRTQCTAMLRGKEDQARKQLLELEFAFHSKQSQVKASSLDNSSAEMTRLIETIDSLNLQLDQATRDKEQVKKQLVQNQQTELKKLHEKYQVEMETLRLSEHSAKEQSESLQMQMLSLQSQTQVATTQARNAKAALEDLTKKKVLVLEEKNQRLEREIAALKLQQRNQKEAPTSCSVAKQDVEALEKHLNNKIEYLKAQLASEMKCKEELGTHLAQMTNAMEQMKVERRQALAEQEEAFKKQSERVESAFSQEKELLTTQQAALQGKLVTLQANVTDLVQELTMWKSREANAKLAMEKMVEENVRLTRQLVDAEGQVEALQEERKQDTATVGSMSVLNASEETKRVQMEALLRRLDNERQYLKSQLEDQQEMKEKSQKQVTELKYQLEEVRDAMEDALRVSEQKISTLMSEKHNQEQELRGTIECLEEGKLLLSRQLKDVQIKFTEAREQSLVERDEIDKSRIQVSEMRALLLSAKEDSVKEQMYAKNASERMSKSLSAVKTSLKAMEEEKNLQIKRLEDENSHYMGKLATTQGEMLVLEEKMDKEKLRVEKEMATLRFTLVLSEKVALWRLRMQHRAFSRAKLLRLFGSQDARRAQELGRLEERLREEYIAKCDEMTQSLHDERLEVIRRMKEEHDRDRQELNEFYLQEKSQLQEDLTAVHTLHMQQMKETFESLSKKVEADAHSKLDVLEAENDKLQQIQAQLTEEVAEMAKKGETMANTFEEELTALRTEWEAKQEDWNAEKDALQVAIQAQRDQLEENFNLEISKLTRDHEIELTVLKEAGTAAELERHGEFSAQIAMVSEELRQRYVDFHTATVSDLKLQHQRETEEEINAMTEKWQQEMENLRQAQVKALKEAVEKSELKGKTQLESLQKEMNERKGTAVVQCTSKWQRAMEELQERQEMEKKVVYNEGLQDREKEWQQAALQIKERQREELDKVQQEAVAAVRAAEERHEMRFQAQLAELKKELEEKHSQALVALTEEITTRERERAQEHFDANVEVMEQELTAKWTEKLEEQQIELENNFVQEKTSLIASLVEEKDAALGLLRQAHEEQRVQLEKEWSDQLQEVARTSADTREQELEALREELEDEKKKMGNQLQQTFEKQLEEQLADQEARLLREQEDAIGQVQEDSEKLIEQVERAMMELKKQKEQLETELQSLRSALEEAEDAQFDAQETFKKQQKRAVFHVLNLVMRAMKRISEETQAREMCRAELESKVSRLKTEFSDEKSRWEELMTRIRDFWAKMQTQHSEMTQTLTNYKRDELVAHRSSSAVLSNEISIVMKQLEEVEEMKITLEKDIETLQNEAQMIEASLRDLMVQSGGSLNMAVVAKKRRLNEEFEALLERIEKKKTEIRTVDQTLASLRVRREEKEQEMRAMERKLVEILVQQQKQMLLLLSAVREVSLPTIAT